MDRSHSSAPQHSTAVRTAGSDALDLLLPAAAGERGELAAVARPRRAVPEVTVLRQPQDGRRVRRGPSSRPTADAHFGNRSSLSQAAPESPGPRSPDLPDLLRDVVIERPNQVWSTDITYIPLRGGFLYLVAVMDWFSRYVLSWELSNTMETGFCLEALDTAFRFGQPEIWNSDQGSQFTSADFLAPLKKRGVRISMDGRGRALDNVFIERLWRSLKYELIYLGDFASGA